ncbi:MAG: hypothetical protein WBX15_20880 [Thermoanaerobaculia bacterium]
MKRFAGMITVALVLVFSPIALFAADATWKNVSIVDTNCHAKFTKNADAHTRSCALKCAKSGFGVITPDGKFLAFDAKGNELATAALKSSTKKDHLRATVVGEQSGETIAVKSLVLD